MVSCCVVGLGASDGVTIGIGLLGALECSVGARAGAALGALHIGGRRLVMELRPQGLWTGRTAAQAGRGQPDLSLELRDLRRARSAMGSAAAEHGGSERGNQEAADISLPPNGSRR